MLVAKKILDVFAAVQEGTIAFGVVPLENSSYGSVVYTLDLLADSQSQYTAVTICGEVYLNIHHYLLGHRNPAQHRQPYETITSRKNVPGDVTPTNKSPNPKAPKSKPLTDVSHVERIYSHYQAFGQCSSFLSTFLKGAEHQEVSSTSKGAELVSRDTTGTFAAISSKTAAQVHGLDILAECIEDRDDNKTRFLIISRTNSQMSLKNGEMLNSNAQLSRKGAWKTLITFTIDHCKAGALAKALLKFEMHSLNLTSINSRPSGVKPWHYIFLVECEGSREDEKMESVDEVLQELKEITEGCRCYGSWDSKSSPTG